VPHYEFVPGDSEVIVHARAPLHTTTARSRKVTGEFNAGFDDNGALRSEVDGFAEVRLDSFGSGNMLLDINTLRHLGARRNPVVRFTIASVGAGDDDRVRVAGTLEFAGNSQPIAADVVLDRVDEQLEITGTWTLVQSDFGLKTPRLAMLSVDDEVAVEFRLVATARM
jgi:polyisoprenoid-binding protein YceI